jgi:hypothetical protein
MKDRILGTNVSNFLIRTDEDSILRVLYCIILSGSVAVTDVSL